MTCCVSQHFYRAVDEYRGTVKRGNTSTAGLLKMAREIFRNYVQPLAPYEVNIR